MKRKVIITINEEFIAAIGAVKKKLQEYKFEIGQELDEVGIITGDIDEEDIDSLKKEHFVDDIEDDDDIVPFN